MPRNKVGIAVVLASQFEGFTMNGLKWEDVKRLLRIIGVIIAAITGTTVVNTGGCGKRPDVTPSTPPSTSPAPAPAPIPAAMPWPAIGKIQIGTYGCSATVIGKRLANGEYDILSAAHCLPEGIKIGVMKLDNGKEFGIRLMAIDRNSDCAWLRTVGDVGELPYAELGDGLPVAGDPVWHGGYGEHKPRNRENGRVVNPVDSKGQSQFWISVSSGDSGGGIICDKTGKVLASVCCTTERNAPANVWGCSVESMRKFRPKELVSAFEWNPIEVPEAK